MKGSRKAWVKSSSSDEKFWSLLAQAEHARAAIAVERLQDDVAMGAAEGGDLGRVAGDQRVRHELRIAAGR